MSTTPETVKLAQLRAKTDRQLIAVIDRALDRGLELMPAGGDRAKAEGAYAEAVKLLPLVYELNEAHRRRLEGKVDALRDRLGSRFRTAGA